jgi:hypothetical protein
LGKRLEEGEELSKRNEEQDPILQLAEVITLLSPIFMVGFAISFNLLPLLVSIIGFVAGLYIIALKTHPKEAKYWREFMLDKLNLLFNWGLKMQNRGKHMPKRGHLQKYSVALKGIRTKFTHQMTIIL